MVVDVVSPGGLDSDESDSVKSRQILPPTRGKIGSKQRGKLLEQKIVGGWSHTGYCDSVTGHRHGGTGSSGFRDGVHCGRTQS